MEYFGKRFAYVLITISSLLVLIVFWISFAPTQMGGKVTYVIVDGNSMEPLFHFGDLVMIRREPAYEVGDAVVYGDPNMGIHVFHRIVEREADRFVLQGDHNSWLDSYTPTEDEIVGKLWLHVPALGKAINWMRAPIHVSLTAGLLGGIMMLDMFRKPSKSRNKKQLPIREIFGNAYQPVLIGLGLLGTVFLVLGIVSFVRPPALPSEAIPYQQEGNYFYSAAGTPGVYDTEVIRAGEPIFPKLTCFLNVGFTYNLIGTEFSGVSGSQSMYARVFDIQSGWQRTIPLTSASSFSGTSYLTTATLDLCQVESLVNLVEKEAGVNQIIYSLEIVSDTAFTATVNGVQVGDTFSPKLTFTYDKIQFYLADSGSGESPLHVSKSGMAGNTFSRPNTISLFGLPFPVWLLRVVSVTGFGISLAGLIAVGLYWYRSSSQNEETLIRLKYGNRFVRINDQSLAPTGQMIDVTSMEDLARLADRHGAMILHMAQTSGQYYFVQAGSSIYRYAVRSPALNESLSEATSKNKIQPADPAPKKMSPLVETGRKDTPRDTGENSEPAQAHTPQAERKYNHRSSSRVESKSQGSQALSAGIPQYTINSSRINRAISRSETLVEYVIDSGVIECTLPPRDASVLSTIKLQSCDPSFD